MRTFWTISSFFIVLGLYFLYGWVAVPLLLPAPEDTARQTQEEDPTREEIEPYLALFPQDSWERDPKSDIHYLQFGETILLFGKDESNGNVVKLQPCTVLMIQGLDDPDLNDKEREERIHQAIVMRTPLYAEIEFDKEFNLGQFPLPDIKGGRLSGKVTIESAMKEAGPQDDFFLETEDVAITESPGLTRITTFKDVQFRFGYNNGEGSMFSMELTPSDPKKPKSPKTLSLVRFEHLKHLNLVFPDDPQLPPKVLADQKIVPSGSASLINVQCQREFLFQSVPAEKAWIARFFGNTQVVRTNPDGSTDHLTAEEVNVKFLPKVLPKAVAAKPAGGKPNASVPNAGLNHLEPVSFEANGRLQPTVPARLISKQSGGVQMTGDHLLYDIRRNFLVLETQTLPGASKEVEIIVQNRYVIRGEKSFQYTLGQNGEFGKLVSDGKGNLRGNLGDEKAPRNMFLSWNALSAEPYPMVKNQIVLKMWNGIAADMEGFGKMTAGKLDLWCNVEPQKNADPKAVDPKNQAPSNTLPGQNPSTPLKKDSLPGGRNNITPDRAVVMDNVHFSNDKGTCDVSRLDIFFKTVAANGAVAVSRWLPRILTEQPPTVPGNAQQPVQQPIRQPIQQAVQQSGGRTYAVSNIPSKLNGAVIQQVQYNQPQQPQQQPQQPPPGLVPLYQAKPAPPVGNQSPTMVKPNNVARSAAPASASQQSLLGIQSSNSAVQYAIVGRSMNMQVVEYAGRSLVESVVIEGDVKITERIELPSVPNVVSSMGSNSDMIQITGEEISVWNPSSPETQIMIVGKQKGALFKGRGIELQGREINISRPSNKIWVPGTGRLLANTESSGKYFQTKDAAAPSTTAPTATGSNLAPLVPLKPMASNKDNRLLVEWNESMIFDGNVLQFFGKPGRDSNRVWTIYQTKQIWCDIMEIRLNRMVSFFEDKSDIKPEAEMIQCANNVIIESRDYDENTNQLKAQDSAVFGKLRFWIKSNTFAAEGPSDAPGVLRMTHLSSDKGFSDSKINLPGQGMPTAGGSGLSFLSVWFHDQIQGTILGDQRDVTISGRVQTVYTPVDSWDDKIGIDNINAARRRGYILECEKLHIVEMPDPNNGNKSSVELTASENASIDGNKVYGKAKTIKYNQAKTLVTFDGNAKIHSLEDGKKMDQAADSIQYNLETKAVRIVQAREFNLGQ